MILAGTGHRPNGLTTNKRQMYTNGLVNALAEFYLLYIRKLKPERVISGGALGADMGLAVAALRYGVPLTLAVPHYGQESKWKPEMQKLYYKIMDRAKDVIYVEQGPYAAWKMQRRNEFMVDRSTLLLALWSGNPGGTANCIQYANTVGREILNVWDDWTKFKPQYKF